MASSLEGLYNDASCVQLFLLPAQEVQLMKSHALVISQMDYCNVLYVGLALKNIQKLQLVQNMGSYLCELHWLPVGFKAKFKMLVVPYKALNDMWPFVSGHYALPTRICKIGIL